ncbi:hypothetical protein K432DRAFT_285060 [Lepidopterella palustris CBS 459.81]|uniref:Xylanolytic transcriptional activator regulatory domain-containing protein n=1 Tax=Lepidopterella palustris CBS 459.81 TaxID=1314670 RepID=A0A8E2ELZ0_9PEZI|nr:hypothetical protein K432DRAFT_285060 [Lepidopterella palustris CBS 459.81]
MSTMITFAANNEFFRKRKRVHRACEACKKRRKRCSHTFDEDVLGGNSAKALRSGVGASNSDHDASETDPSSEMPAPIVESGREDRRNSGRSPSNAHDPRPMTASNFVGYLNPQAVLREEVHGSGSNGSQHGSQHDVPIGQWIQEREDRRDWAVGNRPGPSSVPMGSTSPQSFQGSKVQKALQTYLDAVDVAIIPPRPHQDALKRIYFTYVQPLLPLVHRHTFESSYAQGNEPCMLMQAICIVASKHIQARPHLLLSNDPRLLNPREFSQRLYDSIIAGIEAKLESNRIVLIQVLALLSLHSEGPDGAEQASMHLAQAIHHAHTFGLQFGRQGKISRDESVENLDDLFWCLWSLDKINACINGRPLLMHDRDNGLRKLPTDPEKRQSPFGVWLQISEMLDKVISYYRPGVDAAVTGWEGDDFLGFEELVGDGEDRLEGPTITVLSLFHHTMAMASHKSLSINDPVRSSPSYVRQSLSATRVISILTTEPPETLPPLPIIPYALSMALSVVYRHFRQRKLQMHRNRAKEELKSCVALLNRLRTSWWSAGAMADLGMAALSNADRGNRTKASGTISRVASPSNTTHNSAQPSQTTQVNPIDPRLQDQQAPTPLSNFDLEALSQIPGQHPISSERAEQCPLNDFDFSDSSPDWLNFDTAFENMDTLLGSSGADLSNELFKSFNYDSFDFLDSAISL